MHIIRTFIVAKFAAAVARVPVPAPPVVVVTPISLQSIPKRLAGITLQLAGSAPSAVLAALNAKPDGRGHVTPVVDVELVIVIATLHP